MRVCSTGPLKRRSTRGRGEGLLEGQTGIAVACGAKTAGVGEACGDPAAGGESREAARTGCVPRLQTAYVAASDVQRGLLSVMMRDACDA